MKRERGKGRERKGIGRKEGEKGERLEEKRREREEQNVFCFP